MQRGERSGPSPSMAPLGRVGGIGGDSARNDIGHIPASLGGGIFLAAARPAYQTGDADGRQDPPEWQQSTKGRTSPRARPELRTTSPVVPWREGLSPRR